MGRGDHRLDYLVDGADRDRTDDLLVANQMLSQLSYRPGAASVYRETASDPLD